MKIGKQIRVVIDVFSYEKLAELQSYFTVELLGVSPASMDVAIAGGRDRIRSWMELNLYYDIEELYPELYV